MQTTPAETGETGERIDDDYARLHRGLRCGFLLSLIFWGLLTLAFVAARTLTHPHWSY